jgi:hypothetical protein
MILGLVQKAGNCFMRAYCVDVIIMSTKFKLYIDSLVW